MGQPLAVAKGVYWLRMPLPFSLNHINLWLLEDDVGWTIVDTGINTSACKELWQHVFDNHLNNKPVHQLVVTHLHPDHVGLAGWICETWGLELQMSRMDYMACRVLMSDTGKPAPKAAISFYQRAGVVMNSWRVTKPSLVVMVKAFTPCLKAMCASKMVNQSAWLARSGTLS